MTELLTMATSPAWAYLALLALLVVDAFVPVVPTQAIMITAGALTALGVLDLWLTVAVGATGVFAGDLATYLLGRSAGLPTGDGRLGRFRRRWVERLRAHSDEPSAARRAAARFTRGLRTPGPLVLLLCRFVPGGRMAAGFQAGRRHYPARLFVALDGAAAIGWATYGGLVGHIGGTALTQNAWRLFAIAAVAAVIFGTAGWVLALSGGHHADDHSDDEPATGVRAASADEQPQRSNPTRTGRS